MPLLKAVLSSQEDPEWTAEKELCMRKGIPYVAPKQKENIEDEEYMSAEASSLSVGERCEVDPGGKRRRHQVLQPSGTNLDLALPCLKGCAVHL